MESQPPPPTLYHYTNDVGLRGILESGAIWLTDLFNLNDPSELRHGFSHAIRILQEKASQGPPESKTFAKRFEAFAIDGGVQKAAHYFISSFSSNGDEIGQWRAYADNGKGYALAFDTSTLEACFAIKDGRRIPNNFTFSVLYDEVRLADFQRKIIDSVFNLISLPRGRQLRNEAINAYMVELAFLTTLHTLRIALYFKHPAYRGEEEYRFLQVHASDQVIPAVKVRTRPYSLVRYREFDWRTSALGSLKGVVVGPSADREKAVQFVNDCITSFHPRPIEITRSQIPYRAL